MLDLIYKVLMGCITVKTYEIFSEGYIATGGSSGHVYHGSSTGETFKEACINYAKTNKEFAEYFDENRMTYWGCRLFDNATDASKAFG